MRDLFGFHHAFFDPLWRRVATTCVVGGWSVFEYYAGAPVWGLLFAILTILAVYYFFIAPRDKNSNSP